MKNHSVMANLNQEYDADYIDGAFVTPDSTQIARQQTDINLADAYERTSIVTTAVDAQSSIFSSTEFSVHRITNSDGDSEEVEDHPVIDLLYNPNTYQTKTQFLSFYAVQMLVFGRAFILKKKAEDSNEVLGLEILPSMYMEVKVSGGELEFTYNDPSTGQRVPYPSDEIIFICNAGSVSPIIGQSPVRACAAELFLLRQAVNYQHYALGAGAVTPDSYIKVDASDHVDIANKEVQEQYVASAKAVTQRNRERLPILHNADIKTVRMTPKEIDFIATVQRLEDAVLHAFRLPRAYIGEVQDANRSNMQEIQRVLSETVIEPMQKLFSENIQKDLIIKDFGLTDVLRYETNYKQSLQDRMETATLGYSSGDILTETEAREIIGYDKMEDSERDDTDDTQEEQTTERERRENVRASTYATRFFKAKDEAVKMAKKHAKRKVVIRGANNRGMDKVMYGTKTN